MKKFIFTIFIIIYFYISLFSTEFYNPPLKKFDEGTLENQIIRLIPERVRYTTGDDIKIIFSKENLSDERQEFWGVGYMRDPDDFTDLGFDIEGINADLIDWRLKEGGGLYSGGMASVVKPHTIYIIFFHLNTFMDFSKVGSGVLTFKGKYVVRVSYWGSENASTSKRYGMIYPEPFRIFVNMGSELIDTDIEVHPDKWNLNWFNMAQEKGVFSVWIRDFPKGYSPDDVKQDTILMNGVLKPVDVKTVSEDGKDMMHIRFSKREGISYIGYIRKSYKKKINISGRFKDGKWFYGEAEIEITGKKKNNRNYTITNKKYLKKLLGDEEYEKVKNLD